uniref:DNA replication protein n=1 Tax=Vibrio cholerae TaxID=666 RepID=A0A6M4NQ04_VIBCL|nr:DNA replication protein [Vibrio cholerae]
MGSCAAPSAKGDDKFITTDYLQQCPVDNLQSLLSIIAAKMKSMIYQK